MSYSTKLLLAATLVAVTAPALAQSTTTSPPASAAVAGEWHSTLVDRMRLFGHRNWIAVVDSAYPAQSSAGVETIATDADQLEVVKIVLDAIAAQRHVRPKIYLDAELMHVPVIDAPGIDRYRADLAQLLGRREAVERPHAEIIEALDAAGGQFRVLVLKTNLTLPYTSVFIELDCGYWSADAEERLRAKMDAAAK